MKPKPKSLEAAVRKVVPSKPKQAAFYSFRRYRRGRGDRKPRPATAAFLSIGGKNDYEF